MLFIIVACFFLLWCAWIVRSGKLSWHSVLSIYFVTLFAVDLGDVPFAHWIKLYYLHAQLLNNPNSDQHLAIVLSDGLIFPLVAIIFCYYVQRFRRPWLLSILFATGLGGMEFVFVKYGYMIYHNWNFAMTPTVTFILLRVLAHFADNFLRYSPPVSYRLRFLCALYAITEWPGTILGGGVLFLYQFRPGIFQDKVGDDRLVAMSLAIAMGLLAIIAMPLLRQRYRIYLFLALGVISTFFAFLMHANGLLLYNHWNNFITVIRYITPYSMVYLYDRWEGGYLVC